MRLFLVIQRKTAQALREGRRLLHIDSLILDDIEEGTVQIPGAVFYHFPWLMDLQAEFPEADYLAGYEQIAMDVPDEIARMHERPDPDGGNSTWRLPLELVVQFMKQ